jgi:hypothetical protein
MWNIVYRVLMEKPGGKRPLGRPRRRWEDNIQMDFHEVEWGDIDRSDLIEDEDMWRFLVNTVINLRVRQNARNFLTN